MQTRQLTLLQSKTAQQQKIQSVLTKGVTIIQREIMTQNYPVVVLHKPED